RTAEELGGGLLVSFFFQAEDGIRDWSVTGVQTCALPIWAHTARSRRLCLRASSNARWWSLLLGGNLRRARPCARARPSLLPRKPSSPAHGRKSRGATSSASYSAPSRRAPGQASKTSAQRSCS